MVGSASPGSASEGHVCYIDHGKEPNYHDYECKSYFSCNDYWGTIHYCPDGYQVSDVNIIDEREKKKDIVKEEKDDDDDDNDIS